MEQVLTARLLVVDDVPANGRLLAARLDAEYYDVRTVSNGRDVQEIATFERLLTLLGLNGSLAKNVALQIRAGLAQSATRFQAQTPASGVAATASGTIAALAAGDVAGAQAKAQGWIYAGYKMTIFSTAEEQQREPLEIHGKVRFYPDFALQTASGNVTVQAPWSSYALQDRELISGQNPFSDQALLKLLLQALEANKTDRTRAASAR